MLLQQLIAKIDYAGFRCVLSFHFSNLSLFNFWCFQTNVTKIARAEQCYSGLTEQCYSGHSFLSLSHLFPVAGHCLHSVCTSSFWRSAEWPFSFPWLPLDDTDVLRFTAKLVTHPYSGFCFLSRRCLPRASLRRIPLQYGHDTSSTFGFTTVSITAKQIFSSFRHGSARRAAYASEGSNNAVEFPSGLLL